MSFYPFRTYIRRRSDNKIFAVDLSGYRQSISFRGFYNLNVKLTFKLSKKLESLHVYHGAYTEIHDVSMAREVAKETPDLMSGAKWVAEAADEADKRPFDLYEFYEHIGFDRKTKKINGMSYRAHLLQMAKQKMEQSNEK